MRAEIHEQPDALERIVRARDRFREGAALLARTSLIRLAAHGTSDAAGTFGVYAFGIAAGRTALRDAMSLTVYYDAPLRMDGEAVIAISQSGHTPDVVEHAVRARARGAAVLCLTNDLESPLAEVSDVVIPLCAGHERAVAATKTYTTSVAALGLLAAELGGTGDALAEDVCTVAALIRASLDRLTHDVGTALPWFEAKERLFAIARGLELATARETALKLKETCRIAAESLSATDLAHGPVAVIDPRFPVWVIAPSDPTSRPVEESARRAAAMGATLIAVGEAARTIVGAAVVLETPRSPQPLLAPLLSILPGQLLALRLSVARGLDPDAPHGLAKVTKVP